MLVHGEREILQIFVIFERLPVLCLVCFSPLGYNPAIQLWICGIHFHVFNPLQKMSVLKDTALVTPGACEK